MKLKEKINKIKIAIFGNKWTFRTLETVRYLGCLIIAWSLWKSDKLFFGYSILKIIKLLWNWDSLTAVNLVNNVLKVFFITSILILYLFLTERLIKGLTSIYLPADKQVKIIKSRSYILDKQTSYIVTSIDELEAIETGDSHCIKLIANLSLSLKGFPEDKKQIRFVCYIDSSTFNELFSPQGIKSYFPETNIIFGKYFLFTWKKIAVAIVHFFAILYLWSAIKHGYEFNDQPLGNVVKGEAAEFIKRLEKEKEAKEVEEKRGNYMMKSGNITITLNDIGGLHDAKDMAEWNAGLIKDKVKLGEKSPARPFHMLLWGPPGTGKTMLGKWIAKESGADFAFISGENLKADDKGASSKEKLINFLKNVIAESRGRHIVCLIDEIDGMGYYADKNSKNIGKELLGILDGVDETYKNIIFVATTNHIGTLLPSLLRAGRLHKKILINYPGLEDLENIVEVSLRGLYKNSQPSHPKLFGKLLEKEFVDKYTKFVYGEMIKNKYQVDLELQAELSGWRNDAETKLLVDAMKKMPKETKKRCLFVGADVKSIIEDAINLSIKNKSKELSEEHFKKSIELNYDMNKAAYRDKEITEYLRKEMEQHITMDELMKERKKQRDKYQHYFY